MFEGQNAFSNQFRTYRVDAEEFVLAEGDRIEAGQQIGVDVNTGSPLFAIHRGYVATVYYNPMSHSFLMMTCRQDNDEIPFKQIHVDEETVSVLCNI
jgi:hypothetical protein